MDALYEAFELGEVCLNFQESQRHTARNLVGYNCRNRLDILIFGFVIIAVALLLTVLILLFA